MWENEGSEEGQAERGMAEAVLWMLLGLRGFCHNGAGRGQQGPGQLMGHCMHVCVCVHACIPVHVCMRVHLCIYVHCVHVYVSACTCIPDYKCMCVCLYMYMCACIQMCTHMCTCICMCICAHACTCAHVYAHMHVHLYRFACTHVNVCMYVRVYTCIYVYIYLRTCMHEYMYCTCVCLCVCMCLLGGGSTLSLWPGTAHTDAQQASPQMQTSQPWSVRNPPGPEQLLLNQGQGQPRGRVGFGGFASWADGGWGRRGALH